MPQENYYIAHWGIKGQKWGLRRFRNYDDTLTEAGKRRYGDGGARAIKKAEKERQRRAQILADPTKLYKHRSEFTNAEIENAMAKFDTAARLKEAARKEKAERRADFERKILGGTKEERLEKAAMKDKFKTQHEKEESERDIAKAKAEQEKQRLKAAKAQEQRNAAAEERKIESEKKDEKSKKWGRRASTVGDILKLSTSAKAIFDELGVTDPGAGKTLFGSLGKSLGFGNIKVSDVDDSGNSKKKDESDSSENSTGENKSKNSKAETSENKQPKQESKTKTPKTAAKDASSEKNIQGGAKGIRGMKWGKRDNVASLQKSLEYLSTYFKMSPATDAKNDAFVDAAVDWAKSAYGNVPVSKIEDVASKVWTEARK